MKKEFSVIVEPDGQGCFIAEVPELAGCHTQAKSLDVLLKRTKVPARAQQDVMRILPGKSR